MFQCYQCDNCGYPSIAMWRAQTNNVFEEQRDRNETGIYDAIDTAQEMKWIPQNPLGKQFDDVPEAIACAASEAFACASVGLYRAAILLSRSIVEACAKDQGITRGNLAEKIDKLAEEGLVSQLVRDQAHEIRYFGNDMAHGDFIIPVKAEEAEEVLNFLEILLNVVYQQPAKLHAMQIARQERKTLGKTRQQ